MKTSRLISAAAGIMAAFTLTACEKDSAPRQKPPATTEKQDQSANTPADTNKSGTLCIGVCVGPHINLQNGQIEFIGVGPGLNL